MKIIQDLIPAGTRNRPTTVRGGSRYGIIVPPKWITIHNAWSPWDAKGLNDYQKTDGCINRPASWHLSVSDGLVYQGIPFGETAWHAGDFVRATPTQPAKPGTGNSQTIGIEICDFYDWRTKTNNQTLYLLAEAYSTKLVAHLIKTVPSLLPFPECVVPHTKWRPSSGCPSRILGRRNGWQEYLDKVEMELSSVIPTPPALPDIQRCIGVEVDGVMTDENAYLIDNATYVRMAYTMKFSDIKVTGHGDHIKIVTK